MEAPVPHGESAAADGIDPALVRTALARVLASRSFAGAERPSRFLRYTVERTLEGAGDQVKEYVLGVEVFDRTASFDPRLDTIVRVEARRLRARLAEYYADEGATDPLTIDLPRGGYVPHFTARQAAPAEGPAQGQAGAPAASSADGEVEAMSARLIPAAIGLLIVVGIGLGWTWLSAARPTSRATTVAVLPLENYSGDPRQDTLAARLTDGIITELARVPTIGVRSRTTVLQYKNVRRPLSEIARALDVSVVLEGGVVAEHGTVKVNVRLVHADSDRKFWVESFTGSQKDVRALEREVSRAVADALIQHATPPS